MAFARGPKTVTDGLVLYLDAANPKSYPGSGTTWYDLSGKGNHAQLYNSPVWNNTYFSFDGVNSYGIFEIPSSILPFSSSQITYEISFQEQQNGIEVNRQEIMFGNKAYNTSKDGFALTHGANPNDIYSQINDFGTNSLKVINSGINLDDDGLQDDTLNFPWVIHFTQIDNTNLTSVSHKIFNFSNSPLIINSVTDTVANVTYPDLLENGTVYSIGSGITNGRTTRDYTVCDIAYIKIYNKILSDSEIQQNYNALKSRYNL